MEARNRNGIRRLRPTKLKRLVQEEPSSPKRTPTKRPKRPSRKTELTANIIQAAMAEIDKTGKVPIYVGNVKLSFEDQLYVLEKRRDVGLWVQCTEPHCSKWRYIEDIKDPADVPFSWYCHMNKDPQFNACFKPEQERSKEIEEDLIENKFTAGSIVWAKFGNYPYWPGMVEDDSTSLRFYEVNAENPQKVDFYHVSFFDNLSVNQAWIPADFVCQFKDGNETFEVVQKNHLQYISRVEEGKKMALKALQMDITLRLQTFNALKRYRSFKQQKRSLNKRHDSRRNIKHFDDCNGDSDFESYFSYKDDYETDYEDNRTPSVSRSEENLNNSVGLFGYISTHLKSLSRSLFGSLRKPF